MRTTNHPQYAPGNTEKLCTKRKNLTLFTVATGDEIYAITTRIYIYIYIYIYRVSQEERTKLREGVPYVKLYRYNPKHLCPKLNGFRDNGKCSLKL